MEYLEEGADIESCFPVRKEINIEGVDCRELTGGRFATLVHRGPYDQLFRSYARMFAFLKARDVQPAAPLREVYHKGPGMIFRGNPAKYVTEIQFLF
jgi:effector-binding domain-containing protein